MKRLWWEAAGSIVKIPWSLFIPWVDWESKAAGTGVVSDQHSTVSQG